ncbi:MAG: hypothetical protein IBX63_11205 [Coriobacteriia bacterium]|nr:hypothetical protein [Coriobacteriia bacterium]
MMLRRCALSVLILAAIGLVSSPACELASAEEAYIDESLGEVIPHYTSESGLTLDAQRLEEEKRQADMAYDVYLRQLSLYEDQLLQAQRDAGLQEQIGALEAIIDAKDEQIVDLESRLSSIFERANRGLDEKTALEGELATLREEMAGQNDELRLLEGRQLYLAAALGLSLVLGFAAGFMLRGSRSESAPPTAAAPWQEGDSVLDERGGATG